MSNIYKIIPEIMNDLGAIGKNAKGTTLKFDYRSIDEIVNNLNPILCNHKVFIVPSVLESSREERPTKNDGKLIYTIVKASFRFYAEDGSFVEATTIGEASDSADKSSAKALTSAYKQALLQIFCIPTEDLRAERPATTDARVLSAAVPNEKITSIMLVTLQKKIKVKGANEGNICVNCHISALEEMTINQYKTVMEKLDKFEDEVNPDEA